MSNGKKIDSILHCDPDALEDVVRFLNERVEAPVVTGLQVIVDLQTEAGRVQAAYETGRRSLVDELVAAQRQMAEESRNG